MEKLSTNHAQLFLRNKYTVFTMGGTVCLTQQKNFFLESYSSTATQEIKYQNFENKMSTLKNFISDRDSSLFTPFSGDSCRTVPLWKKFC